MRAVQNALIIVVCLLAFQSKAFTQDAVDRQADILTLRFLLANDLFAQLEERGQEYQQASVQRMSKDELIHRAVRAFRVNDERLGDQLDRWVGMYSRSAVAHASRGAYHFYIGRAYARSGRHTDAEPYLQRASQDLARATELDNRFLEGKILTIEMLTSFGDLQNAKRILDEVLEASPAAFHARRVYLWGLSPHTNPGADQEMQRVIADAGQYAAINPRLRYLEGFPDLFRGLALQSEGKHEQAVAAFSLALEAGAFYEFFLFRAMSYAAQNESQKALEDYEAVLARYRQSIDGVRGKAQVLRQLGRDTEADQYDALAQELMSFVAPVRGGIISEAEAPPTDLPDQDEPSDKGMTMAADSAVADEQEAEQPVETDQADADLPPGIDDLTARIEQDPQNASLRFERGMAYLDARALGKAEEDFNKTIELDPSDVRAHFNLGWIYLHSGMYEQGIAKNSDAIALNPGFGQAYLNRAFGLRMLGRMDEAGRDLQQACSLGVEKACTLLGQ